MTTGQPESAFVDGPCANLANNVAREGPGLVLVHAGICDWSTWDSVVPRLATSHRAVELDCRGFVLEYVAHGPSMERPDELVNLVGCLLDEVTS